MTVILNEFGNIEIAAENNDLGTAAQKE